MFHFFMRKIDKFYTRLLSLCLHLLCFLVGLCCFFLVLTFGYYKSPPSCCNSCSRVECFVLFLEVKIPEGVGQNEKSSPTFVNRNACVFVLICVSRERKFSCFISSCSKEVW